MARWYAYGYVGLATGNPGSGGSLAAGPVWNCERPLDYVGLFFTTTLGGTGAGLSLFPGKNFALAPGGVFSAFWSPQKNQRLGKYCVGFKAGVQLGISQKASVTYNFSATWYHDVSNWPGFSSIVDFFNSQVVAPAGDDPSQALQFANAVQTELPSE